MSSNAVNPQYEVAAYYFPNYHVDPRNEKWHGRGWTEWELMKHATPRFEGHQQPKIPLWGYEDESDPRVMEKKIDAAADHGLTSFIFDWYWYENRPYLQKALEEGFLQAANSERMKFSIMWANHDWKNMHPIQRSSPPELLLAGTVTEEEFIDATNHMITTYFHLPNYWRVNGGLYVSFYQIMGLVRSFGSEERTRDILDGFRERVRAAGLGELHLNAIVLDQSLLHGEERTRDVNLLLERLGFDSITSYVWVHQQIMPDFPKTSYDQFAALCAKDYERYTELYRLPYYPNVTMGWDCTPRTIQSDAYDDVGFYPFMPIMDDNSPEQFEKALRRAKQFLDRGQTNPPIVTINAWNEWTEGSYLEPDQVNGMGYLKAVRHVFSR